MTRCDDGDPDCRKIGDRYYREDTAFTQKNADLLILDSFCNVDLRQWLLSYLFLHIAKYLVACYQYCIIKVQTFSDIDQINAAIRKQQYVSMLVYLYINFIFIGILIWGNVVYFSQE